MNEIKVQKIPVKSMLSKSNLPVEDYSVNPYVGCPHACKYCYASFMKRFTVHQEPWETFLEVKVLAVIKHPQNYNEKRLFIWSVTNQYNPMKETYERTMALLKQLKNSGVEISIATKSDLVLRNLDLIKTFTNARGSCSINTLDDFFKEDMDKAVGIERRLAAMNTMREFARPASYPLFSLELQIFRLLLIAPRISAT